ncbi:aspartyl-phosphate phosphatase Spo0E family protein [Paenibacillus sp. SYP-B3998]|uniref:Aspartyl-phosphate phosphatase Spo0E family protein n=1 Tax=Paenibacillus sp. SYP-B3998 TaxID=2678564 RepID=A0A6G3ZZB2_9BACL|nr:aspartyl-phosphate phosphatase Spo0E family protein [Paenibacillus sp. SYP-B3998]NEW06919.1 aspartyl-phosphate phosphatase Spo0E family protein [Paenibacillus sp. SYP-B3998]
MYYNEIVREIEIKRKELLHLFEKQEVHTKDVLKMSHQLDKLLNQFYGVKSGHDPIDF